ncbi:MAG: quinolinate synthase NadA [Lachnospiraceae bacterium]|nr:quinolinate synthase NadA [Lachnospiraceae bacterium]
MNIREMQEEIIRLKKEKDVCILVHAYQSHEIWEIGDFIGDSYGLAKDGAKTDAANILMCGVRFMAETAKILSPEKRVYLSAKDADCPMARQLDLELLEELKKQNPGYAVVAYINTTAEMKTGCDVCVTSSSAVKIIRNMPEDKILFVPDINLGTYVKSQCPDKDIVLYRGGCPTHMRVKRSDVEAARAEHPDALLLVHPEAFPEVCEGADYIGSTTGIMDFAKRSDAKEFIIGTESSIADHLSYECPDKMFYPLSKDLVCHNMALTTLGDIYHFLKGDAAEEIVMSDEMIKAARKPLDRMIELGG